MIIGFVISTLLLQVPSGGQSYVGPLVGGGSSDPAGAATTATDDQTIVSNGTIFQAKTLPNCTDSAGNHLNYTQGTNTFSCGTSVPSDTVTLAGAQSLTNKTIPSFELGSAATDTTITRASAGVMAVEGNSVGMLSSTQSWTGINTYNQVGSITLSAGAGTIKANDQAFIGFGTNNDTRIVYQTADTPDTWKFEVSAESNAAVFCEIGDNAFDFAHALQTNPTIFVHSATQSTTEWTSLTHDQTNGIVGTGAGFLNFTPAAGGVKVTGTAPTVSSCGTSPSTVTGSSSAGRFTWGSGGSDADCTLTFATAWSTAPSCFCNNETNILLVRAVATTTTLTCDVAVAASVESDVINYICVGGN